MKPEEEIVIETMSQKMETMRTDISRAYAAGSIDGLYKTLGKLTDKYNSSFVIKDAEQCFQVDVKKIINGEEFLELIKKE